MKARGSAAIATVALAYLCLTLLGLPGCAVYKVATAPAQKDLTVLKPGTARDRVIAELGPPVRTETIGDSRKDVFTFIQGSSTASKSGMAATIAALDIASLGAAELAFQESAKDGVKKITVAVYYDVSDVVTRSETTLVTQP